MAAHLQTKAHDAQDSSVSPSLHPFLRLQDLRPLESTIAWLPACRLDRLGLTLPQGPSPFTCPPARQLPGMQTQQLSASTRWQLLA